MNENKYVISELQKHSVKMLNDLIPIRDKSIKFANSISVEDKNDLRKTAFFKYAQMLSNLILVIILCSRDNSLALLSSFTICKKPFNIEGLKEDNLTNLFVFCYRNVLSEFIEGFENLLFNTWRSLNPENTTEYYKSLSWLLGKNKETPLFLIFAEILGSEKVKFLLDWQKEYRNPRHHNYYDTRLQKIMGFNFPIDTSKYNDLLDITNNFVQNQKITQLKYVKDQVTQRVI